MIGIEYLCEINKMSYSELAKNLGISRQTINAWTSGRRKVSEKHYEKLKEIFNTPSEYFNKKLTELDKLQLQRIKLENDAVEYTYIDTIWDDVNQQEAQVEKAISDMPVEAMESIDVDIQHQQLFKNIDSLINERTKNAENEWDYIGKKLEVLEMFEVLYEIMKKEIIPYRRIKGALNSINVAEGNRLESDLFIRKLAAVIKAQMLLDKKTEEENIRAAKELLESEDLF